MKGGDIRVFPSTDWPTFDSITSIAVMNNTLVWTWTDLNLKRGGISMLDINTAEFLGDMTLRNASGRPIPLGRYPYVHISTEPSTFNLAEDEG